MPTNILKCYHRFVLLGNPHQLAYLSNVEASLPTLDYAGIISSAFWTELRSLLSELDKEIRGGRLVGYDYAVDFRSQGLPVAQVNLTMDDDIDLTIRESQCRSILMSTKPIQQKRLLIDRAGGPMSERVSSFSFFRFSPLPSTCIFQHLTMASYLVRRWKFLLGTQWLFLWLVLMRIW